MTDTRPQWTHEPIRGAGSRPLRQDIVLLTMAAINEVSTEIAGLTEILSYPGFDGDAYLEVEDAGRYGTLRRHPMVVDTQALVEMRQDPRPCTAASGPAR